MKRNFFLLVALCSLVLSSLACSSLFGGGDEEEPSPVPSPAQATEVVIQQPTATATPEFEEGSIDLDSIWNTMDINSYRGGFTMTFDGTSAGEAVNGSVSMTIEYTSEPPAQHMTISLQGYDISPELTGFDSIEFYVMEDMSYMYMGEEMGWLAFPYEATESISDEFMSYQNFVDLPEKAKRKLLPENVNGVNAWHYVIDKEDLEEEIGTYDEMSADAWIAVDGGYLVKMDVTMSGSFASEDFGFQPMDEGTINIIFNMNDVNGNFTIELPPEALEVESFDLDGDLLGGGEWTREDVPLPDDAEIDFAAEGMVSLYTNLSYDEALEFMLTQLEANGWALKEEPWETEDSYFGDFLNEDETLTLMIDPAYDETDRISIMITIE
jgi:hypothetical protein